MERTILIPKSETYGTTQLNQIVWDVEDGKRYRSCGKKDFKAQEIHYIHQRVMELKTITKHEVT